MEQRESGRTSLKSFKDLKPKTISVPQGELVGTSFLSAGGQMPQVFAPHVEGVDLTIQRGQTLGVVGESGCGKSITATSIMRWSGGVSSCGAAARLSIAGGMVSRTLTSRVTVVVRNPFAAV